MGISKTDRITNCSTYPFFSDPPGRLSRSLSLSHATSYRPVDLSEYTHEASVCGLSPQLCASTGHFVPWRRAGFSVTSHVFTVFPVYSLGWICTEEREVIHSRWEMELKVWSERDKKRLRRHHRSPSECFCCRCLFVFLKPAFPWRGTSTFAEIKPVRIWRNNTSVTFPDFSISE